MSTVSITPIEEAMTKKAVKREAEPAEAGEDQPAAKKAKAAANDGTEAAAAAAVTDEINQEPAAAPEAAEDDAAAAIKEEVADVKGEGLEMEEEQEAEEQQQADEEQQGADGDEEAPPKGDAPAGQPVTLGYRTFTSGQQAYAYIHNVLKNWNLGQPLNEVG